MRNRFNRRRRSQDSGDINITAFMNLMVILVPFLLITAVFSRITILELNLPAAASNALPNKPQEFHLEVIVRDDGIEVGDRNGGLVKRLPLKDGAHDYQQLSQLLQQIKARFPDKLDATLLLEPDTDYETVVQTMDSVRSARVVQAGSVVSAELFPEISIGDAPGTRMKVATK
ncbi:MAG: biopolymer transporter ExbD [Halobacteria archaeon]|nr:biopolymer transporter ExbD [Halobacteria archaeon]